MTSRFIITAPDGMLLTNGKFFARRLELAEWDCAENYFLISVEEYVSLIESETGI